MPMAVTHTVRNCPGYVIEEGDWDGVPELAVFLHGRFTGIKVETMQQAKQEIKALMAA